MLGDAIQLILGFVHQLGKYILLGLPEKCRAQPGCCPAVELALAPRRIHRLYETGVGRGDIAVAEIIVDRRRGQSALDHQRLDALQSLRSEEHTSELQSLMRNSYSVFCSKK